MITRLKEMLQNILHVRILLKHDGNLIEMMLVQWLDLLIIIKTILGVLTTVLTNSLLRLSDILLLSMKLIIDSIGLLVFGDNCGIHGLFQLVTTSNIHALLSSVGDQERLTKMRRSLIYHRSVDIPVIEEWCLIKFHLSLHIVVSVLHLWRFNQFVRCTSSFIKTLIFIFVNAHIQTLVSLAGLHIIARRRRHSFIKAIKILLRWVTRNIQIHIPTLKFWSLILLGGLWFFHDRLDFHL